MAEIFRVVSEWSGFRGGPGYTNFFFRNLVPTGAAPGIVDELSAAAGAERVDAFWRDLVTLIPADVTITINPIVDVLEDSTGELRNSFDAYDRGSIPMGASRRYAAASGAVMSWQTAGIRRGRRIRGRTFIVPLSSDCFGEGGRLVPARVGNLQTSANILATDGLNSTFGVWARPSSKGADDGVFADCTAARVTDLPAVLRSRRD